MRHSMSKVLSLLLALVMVLGMIPTAFATADGDAGGQEPEKNECHVSVHAPWKHNETHHWKECDYKEGGDIQCKEQGTDHVGKHYYGEHKFELVNDKSRGHHYKCVECGYETKTVDHEYELKWDEKYHWEECACGAKKSNQTHKKTDFTFVDNDKHTFTCSECGQTIEAEHDRPSSSRGYKDNKNGTHTFTCTSCKHEVTEAHRFDKYGKCACGAVNKEEIKGVAIKGGDMKLDHSAAYKDLPGYTLYSDAEKKNVTTTKPDSVKWTSDNSKVLEVVDRTRGTELKTKGLGEAKLTLTINGTITDTITVKVVNEKNVSIAVNENIEIYSFADSETEEGVSVYDEIYDALGTTRDMYIKVTADPSSREVATLEDGRSGDSFKDLRRVSLIIKKPGTWTGSYVVTDKDGAEVLTGSIKITIRENLGSDILYTEQLGESVVLDIDTFFTYWADVTSRGTLESVTFGRPSGTGRVDGTLWYEYGNRNLEEDTYNNTYYVNPGRHDNGLHDLTFVPSKSGGRYYVGSVTIPFTARGTSRSTAGDLSSSGTITILYTDGAVPTVNYDVKGLPVEMDYRDFDSVYEQVMGVRTAGYYEIQFLDAPVLGTLYTGATVDRNNRVTGTEVTRRNLVNTYSSKSISKMVYEPGSRAGGDLIRYAVYSGGRIQYIGTINFGVGKLEVNYTSAGAPVTFRAMDFLTNATSLLESSYVTFGAPTAGTLYKNYVNGAGTLVTSRDRFGYGLNDILGTESLDKVTYVPVAGYNGKVQIPFTVTRATGGSVSGVVNITVTGITFPDMTPDRWSYNYVMSLVSAGVVKGDNGYFYPRRSLSNGEALKLVMMAVGYPDLGTTGNDWARGFLNEALRMGYVSNSKLDLHKAITRNEFAELAAKAMGLQPVTTGQSPFRDSTNGYARALYNTISQGERIIAGSPAYDGTNAILFKGKDTIVREEVSKIIYLMYRYGK